MNGPLLKTPKEIERLYARTILQILKVQGVLAFRREWHQVDCAIEARHRLEQMVYALQRLRRLAAATESVGVTLYGEAFYYFSHRAVESISKVSGFGRFRPTGTENVRHHLIEHPVARHRNFTNRLPAGFMLKPYRRPDASSRFPDAGLYLNAQEFIEKLLGTIAMSGMLDEHRRLVAKDKRTRRRVQARGHK